ncbi:MAG: hypothetical protein ACMUIA_00595 [bacterium]
MKGCSQQTVRLRKVPVQLIEFAALSIDPLKKQGVRHPDRSSDAYGIEDLQVLPRVRLQVLLLTQKNQAEHVLTVNQGEADLHPLLLEPSPGDILEAPEGRDKIDVALADRRPIGGDLLDEQILLIDSRPFGRLTSRQAASARLQDLSAVLCPSGEPA